jgi:hypothetical protein
LQNYLLRKCLTCLETSQISDTIILGNPSRTINFNFKLSGGGSQVCSTYSHNSRFELFLDASKLEPVLIGQKSANVSTKEIKGEGFKFIFSNDVISLFDAL